MANRVASKGAALRRHRERLGMTQQEVAERLAQLAWIRERTRVGVNADMVSKWERGQKSPSAFYLRLACLLFDTTPADLAEPSARVAETKTSLPRQRALESLDLVTSGDPWGELVAPQLVEDWRDDVLARRDLIRALGVAPAAFGLERMMGGAPARALARTLACTPESVAALGALVARLEAAYHTRDPLSLVGPVRAVIDAAEDLLVEARDPGMRRSILAGLSRADLLAGRLLFFDVHRPIEARAYLDLAREAATESQDPIMLAAALGHLAFLPAAKGNVTASYSYLHGARETARRRPTSSVTAWISAVESEINARSGDLNGAFRSIDSAREEIADPRSYPVPEWFDFFDVQRLSGFEGFALRRAGRLQEAVNVLTFALEPGPSMGPKQRAVSSVDLAAALVDLGDVDEGCRVAAEAARCLLVARYATAFDRIAEFRDGLPDPRHPAARLFDETIRQLG